MSLPVLTAVICFANEGDEVEHTVRGIRETCGDAVDIILINDASTDSPDYETVADQYSCRYLANENQIGPAQNRHKGLTWAKTENVILMDAHLRFYAPNWHRIVNDAIAADPDALYCVQSLPLKTGGEPSGAPVGIGAHMAFKAETFADSLQPKWNINPLSGTGVSCVPCVLGGVYAARRDYLLKIGGYRGLHRYGGEEPLISMKAWLSGGSCKVIHDVDIGHIYRDSRGAPWTDNIKYYHFNKLATAAILFGDDEMRSYLPLLDLLPEAGSAHNVYASRHPFVTQARREFDKIRRHPPEYFYALNEAFCRGETIIP